MSNSITSQTPLPHPIPAGDELGPLVGQSFGGYEITSYIGEGPTGAVYRGEDLVGTKMAVKVMHQELSRKDAADALWSDLQKLTALRNRHLVTVYDAGFGDDGQFYYAMDALAGCDLEAGLEESGALTPKKALEIIRQVCVAVEAAHAAGVVHGGLKPRNVFLCPRDTELVVKVLDFGAARLAGGVDKGVIVGNPFYMAPLCEQFGGTAEPRTDVYAIGVMMYELFSGTLPFAGPSHGQVMMRHLSESPSTPPGVDPELGRIILRALAKTPAGRFQTVKQLREALERWAKAQPKLEDIVAHHVISRAQEARAMKQAALSMPDATAQMPRYREEEMLDLARPNPSGNCAAEEIGGRPRQPQLVRVGGGLAGGFHQPGQRLVPHLRRLGPAHRRRGADRRGRRRPRRRGRLGSQAAAGQAARGRAGAGRRARARAGQGARAQQEAHRQGDSRRRRARAGAAYAVGCAYRSSSRRAADRCARRWSGSIAVERAGPRPPRLQLAAAD